MTATRLTPLAPEVLARRTQLPTKPDPVVLTGDRVELAPLDVDRDVDALFAVSNGQPFTLGDRRVDAYDADELVWKWMRRGPHADVASLRRDLAEQVATPDMLMLVVRDRPTGHPVGVAAFMANRPADLKIELGSIWYGPIAQGTGASREATRLMCTHAFALGYRRVEWKCDALNLRSQASARSYGFTFEGIQDAHMIVKGRSRDTAWFRLLDREWPHVVARATGAITVELTAGPTADVRALVGELEADLAAGYPPEQRHGLALAAIFQPHIRFFVARIAGAAVGCGGVALFPGFAEVKRMYVRPSARGRGVAEAVLAAIETAARAAGQTVLRLETGDKQHAALGFYRRAGFHPCGVFGDYAAKPAHTIATSLFLEKFVV